MEWLSIAIATGGPAYMAAIWWVVVRTDDWEEAPCADGSRSATLGPRSTPS
jgi:hypothetical protein